MTDSQRRKAIIGAIFIWFVAGVAIDRYLLKPIAPWFSEFIHLEKAEITVEPFSRTFSWLGLTLVLVAPSIVVGVGWSLYAGIRRLIPWKDCAILSGLISFWFCLIPAIMWVGESIYRFLKSFLDDWAWAKGIAGFLDGFTLNGDIHIYSFRVMHIDSGLGAMVGLVVGILLLYRKGLWQMIAEKSGT